MKDVALVTKQLEKLFSNLEQSKLEKNHYQAYKAERELRNEVKQLSKNKKLYQEIKTKNVYLGKKLNVFLETEYEI